MRGVGFESDAGGVSGSELESVAGALRARVRAARASGSWALGQTDGAQGLRCFFHHHAGIVSGSEQALGADRDRDGLWVFCWGFVIVVNNQVIPRVAARIF
jgi:hypothetical protein